MEFHAAAVADPVWSMPIRCSAEKFDLVDVANPRAVLERTLRGYSCLTKVCLVGKWRAREGEGWNRKKNE